jgi:hypothetical protein
MLIFKDYSRKMRMVFMVYVPWSLYSNPDCWLNFLLALPCSPVHRVAIIVTTLPITVAARPNGTSGQDDIPTRSQECLCVRSENRHDADRDVRLAS